MGLSAGNFKPAQLYVVGDYFVGDLTQANPLDLDPDNYGAHLPPGPLNSGDWVWSTDQGTGLAKRGIYVPGGSLGATLDTDVLLTADADDRVVSQKAIRAFVEAEIAGNVLPMWVPFKFTMTCAAGSGTAQAFQSGAGTFNVLAVPLVRDGIVRKVAVAQTQSCTGGSATYQATICTGPTGSGATGSGVIATINTGAAAAATSATGSTTFTSGKFLLVEQVRTSYTGTTANQVDIWVHVEYSA